MGDIYVAVESINKGSRTSKYATVNRVRVGVSHHKGKGVVMALTPAEEHGDGIITLIITDSDYTTLEAAERLSRKKVERWHNEALAAIGHKGHPIQRLIDEFCKKRGLMVMEGQ